MTRRFLFVIREQFEGIVLGSYRASVPRTVNLETLEPGKRDYRSSPSNYHFSIMEQTAHAVPGNVTRNQGSDQHLTWNPLIWCPHGTRNQDPSSHLEDQIVKVLLHRGAHVRDHLCGAVLLKGTRFLSTFFY